METDKNITMYDLIERKIRLKRRKQTLGKISNVLWILLIISLGAMLYSSGYLHGAFQTTAAFAGHAPITCGNLNNYLYYNNITHQCHFGDSNGINIYYINNLYLHTNETIKWHDQLYYYATFGTKLEKLEITVRGKPI